MAALSDRWKQKFKRLRMRRDPLARELTFTGDDVFTYQLIGGVAYAFYEKRSVDAEYRFSAPEMPQSVIQTMT